MRAFLAIELSEDIRTELGRVQEALRSQLGLRGIQWVRPESLHITVKFVGEIQDSLAAVIEGQLQPILREQAPMSLQLGQLGVFPGVRAPRVLWVGFAGPDLDRMIAVVHEVEQALAKIGLPPETRPYQPHLTLGRIKDHAREIGASLLGTGALESVRGQGAVEVTAVSLMNSDLRPSGAVYTRLWACPLRASRSRQP